MRQNPGNLRWASIWEAHFGESSQVLSSNMKETWGVALSPHEAHSHITLETVGHLSFGSCLLANGHAFRIWFSQLGSITDVAHGRGATTSALNSWYLGLAGECNMSWMWNPITWRKKRHLTERCSLLGCLITGTWRNALGAPPGRLGDIFSCCTEPWAGVLCSSVCLHRSAHNLGSLRALQGWSLLSFVQPLSSWQDSPEN